MIPVAYHPHFVLPLPPGHRFPMAKYKELPMRLTGAKTIQPDWFFSNGLMKTERVLKVHTSDYVTRLKAQDLTRQEVRKIGFPLSSALIKREFLLAEATWQCALKALDYGMSFSIAGGTHHAFADHGEGFCLLNDVAIAAANLLTEGKAKRVLVVDLDVHQGNGTAAIFGQTPEVFTFSMHGAKNYPIQKQISDLDISLSPDTGDADYLTLLETHFPEIIKTFQPDFVFYIAGVDVLATDNLGKIQLSLAGCKQRDAFVYQQLCSRNIPCVTVMGGGYSPELNTVVTAHAQTFSEGIGAFHAQKI